MMDHRPNLQQRRANQFAAGLMLGVAGLGALSAMYFTYSEERDGRESLVVGLIVLPLLLIWTAGFGIAWLRAMAKDAAAKAKSLDLPHQES